DGHVLLVQEYVAGQTLDRLDPAWVDDRLLAAMWAEVGRLRAAGVAPRRWHPPPRPAAGQPAGRWRRAALAAGLRLCRGRGPAGAGWPATSPSCWPRWPPWAAPTEPWGAPPRPWGPRSSLRRGL